MGRTNDCGRRGGVSRQPLSQETFSNSCKFLLLFICYIEKQRHRNTVKSLCKNFILFFFVFCPCCHLPLSFCLIVRSCRPCCLFSSANFEMPLNVCQLGTHTHACVCLCGTQFGTALFVPITCTIIVHFLSFTEHSQT